MKIIYYIVGIVLLSAIAYADIQQDFFINSSQLPYASYHVLNITGDANSTIYLNRTDNESRLQIFYPSNVSLNDTNSTIINISFNVPSFASNSSLNLSGNISLFSNTTNQTIYFKLNVVINFSINNSVIDIRIISGSQYVNITSNLLPIEGYLLYNFTGRPNAVTNISCPGNILRCPQNVTIDNQGVGIVLLNYRIEITQPSGVYAYNITFRYDNYSRNSTVIFEIRDPSFDQLRFQWRPDCFVTGPGPNNTTIAYVTRECTKEYDDYNARTISAFLLRLDALNNATKVCPTKIETQYVMSGEINKTIYEEYSQCRQDRTSFSQRLIDTSASLSRMQSSYDECARKLSDNESIIMMQAHEYMSRADAMIQYDHAEQTRKFWRNVYIAIGVLVFISIVSLILYNSYSEYQWRGGF